MSASGLLFYIELWGMQLLLLAAIPGLCLLFTLKKQSYKGGHKSSVTWQALDRFLFRNWRSTCICKLYQPLFQPTFNYLPFHPWNTRFCLCHPLNTSHSFNSQISVMWCSTCHHFVIAELVANSGAWSYIKEKRRLLNTRQLEEIGILSMYPHAFLFLIQMSCYILVLYHS